MCGMTLFEPLEDPSAVDRLARLALVLAARRVPAYDSRFSRRDYTRPQLMACLIIKAAHGLTYRGVSELLRGSASLREALGLRSAPHFTTLEGYANSGQMQEVVHQLLDELMLHVGKGERPRVEEVAMDSTGLAATTASIYFDQVRRGRAQASEATGKTGIADQRRHNAPFIKVSVVVLCGLLLPAALVVTVGRSNDNGQSPELVEQLARRVVTQRLYADAGYDGEPLHTLCRERFGIASYIPPVPKTRDGSIRTRYRAMMRPLPDGYRRRSHVEAFFSAMKRTGGSALRARSRPAQLAEAALRVLAYGIRR